MFDTMQVGRRIRQARIEKNMTQMALADAMGVSFQAVSNWERGGSLPDIGKLPDLCRILEMDLGTLLGEDQPETEIVEKMIDKEPVSPEELALVAPMATPKQAEESIENSREAGKAIPVHALSALVPYLDDEYLNGMMDRIIVQDVQDLIGVAPFLSQESLGKLAEKAEGKVDESLAGLAPFLSEKSLDMLVEKYTGPMDARLMGIAPFLSEAGVRKLAEKAMEQGNYEALKHLGPFM